MLHYSEILDRYDKVRFIQYRDFLKSRSADDYAYSVAPEGANVAEAQQAFVGIVYHADRYIDGNHRAETRLEANSQPIIVISGLPTALGVLLFIFDEPQHLAYLRSLDMTTDATTAVQSLGLGNNVIQSRVNSDKPGNYIAPVDAGWRLYNVDTNGEVSAIADCALPAPLAYVEFTARQDHATGLSARIGNFVPPNARELLRE